MCDVILNVPFLSGDNVTWDDVDDEPELLVRQERVQRHKDETGQHKYQTSATLKQLGHFNIKRGVMA